MEQKDIDILHNNYIRAYKAYNDNGFNYEDKKIYLMSEKIYLEANKKFLHKKFKKTQKKAIRNLEKILYCIDILNKEKRFIVNYLSKEYNENAAYMIHDISFKLIDYKKSFRYYKEIHNKELYKLDNLKKVNKVLLNTLKGKMSGI